MSLPDDETGISEQKLPQVVVTGGAKVTREKLLLAREMRREPTEGENAVCEMLRGRKFLGLKFRRQQVVLGFVVDFYCAEKRLALELDGPIHLQQKEYDAQRDKVLSENSIRVVRVPDNPVHLETLRLALIGAIDL
ncbi:MAG: endonuclease domain-containing protein [Gemmataceae bacterium]